MEIIKIFFFASIFLSIYPYAIYPVVLMLLSIIIRKDLSSANLNPSATLIISAFNEEDVIAKKIENSLLLDYPNGKLEIMIVSDGSTDKTEEIVRQYESKGVVLLSCPIRRGKTIGLNDAVQKAKGDIIVFSDADSMYEQTAIKKMAGLLSESDAGLVTGSTQYVVEGNMGKMTATSSIYTKLERMIKSLETKIGSCVGADGAIFAMSKSLYQPLKGDDINDLVIPLLVVKQGYRVIFHENLYCYEAASENTASEFWRQVRITNRTLRALFRNAELMSVFKYPLFGFELISHKLLRFSVPFFLLALIPLNLLLIGEGIIYKLLLAAQIIFYGAAFVGFYQEISDYKEKKISFVYHFLMVNFSILIGWFKFLSGERQIMWNVK